MPDPHLLARSVLRLARRMRQERRSGLTPNQISVLVALRLEGPMTPGEIAQYERVRPPSATRVVRNLADLGLVTRQPSESDGRQIVVTLADRGAAILDEEREHRDRWLAARLIELDADERELLARAGEIMDRLAQS